MPFAKARDTEAAQLLEAFIDDNNGILEELGLFDDLNTIAGEIDKLTKAKDEEIEELQQEIEELKEEE
jgi:hypothetical protein